MVRTPIPTPLCSVAELQPRRPTRFTGTAVTAV